MLIIADKLTSADRERHSVYDSSFDILSDKAKKSLQIFDITIPMNCREISNCMNYNFRK